ncbi:MAG TPA: hypothetical protein VII08_10900 [Myxococcales bacterium]
MTEEKTPLPEGLWDLFAALGFAMVMAQTTERHMGQTMHVIFGAESFSVDDFMRLENEARRKTLGTLVRALREQVTLDEKFAGILDQFVIDRNTLIHRLDEDEGFDLNTHEGRERCHKLAARIARSGALLQQTFLSFFIAFGNRHGAPLPSLPDTAFVKEVLADANRVWGLVSGPKQARILPRAFDSADEE